MKTITILKRDFLQGQNGGYKHFSLETEHIVYINKTKNFINKELDRLNKTLRTRLYEIDFEVNLDTKKGLDDFIYYIDNNDFYEISKYKRVLDNAKDSIKGMF